MTEIEENPNRADEIDEVEVYRRKHDSSPLKRLLIIATVTGVITVSGLYYAYEKGIERGRELERNGGIGKMEQKIQNLPLYKPK